VASALALTLTALLVAGAAAAVWHRPAVALYAFVVGLAFHNAVMAALYGAGVRGASLTTIQAWKEALLAVALARVARDAVRARRLPFRPAAIDALALAFAAVVVVYALIPQRWLGGSADAHGIALALKHDLVPVGAFLLGRSLRVGEPELRRLAWTLIGSAAAVASIGLVDVFAVPIGWWRDSAVVDYFHEQLGYDYNGTGGLPENFVYNTGSELHFLRRLVSVFLSPLATAYMLAIALLLAASLRRPARPLVAVSALAAAALLFTFSRSTLIALAAGLVVLAAARRRAWPLVAAAATIAVSVGWVHAFPSVAPAGRWTQQDLRLQRENEKQRGPTSGPGSFNESSIQGHLDALRDGARTVVHHPQGYGLGNVGQTASRTDTPIKAGESNYTEFGAEIGVAGALLWALWGLGLLTALLRAGRGWPSAGLAACVGAVLVLAVQTDVVGDPWIAYCLWGLAGTVLSLPAAAFAVERVADRGGTPAPVRAESAPSP
jgi:hypothetical protein